MRARADVKKLARGQVKCHRHQLRPICLQVRQTKLSEELSEVSQAPAENNMSSGEADKALRGVTSAS